MIAVVVPTIRPERMKWFTDQWENLFYKHQVTLITVWDGEVHRMTVTDYSKYGVEDKLVFDPEESKGLIYRFTDSCRNLGFIHAAKLGADYILTLDDDVAPKSDLLEGYPPSQPYDPIQAHLDVLQKKVMVQWMNTAHQDVPHLRGVPYGIRNQAPVMLSHGVWSGIPDWDGETQLKLEKESKSYNHLPFYIGPIPTGVAFPLCGMNVMIRKEALRYFYYAPMGKDTGIEGLNRFGDIWMGIFLKEQFDRMKWACYTGGSIAHHTRASDATKNFELEKLGREWNEHIYKLIYGPCWTIDYESDLGHYLFDYYSKRQRWANLIDKLQRG